MGKAIVDTSAWIEFFKNGDSQIGDKVASLIEMDNAVLVGPVIAELLCGIRSKKESNKLESIMDALPYGGIEAGDWIQCGKTMQSLRTRGITVPLTDALIAAVAKRNGYSLLTLDKHFRHLNVKSVT